MANGSEFVFSANRKTPRQEYPDSVPVKHPNNGADDPNKTCEERKDRLFL